MGLPDSFEIGANRWKIRVCDTVENGEAYGVCEKSSYTIKIARRVMHEGSWRELTEEDVMQTFLHELLHSVLEFLGRDEEALVVGIENVTWQALKTMKWKQKRLGKTPPTQ